MSQDRNLSGLIAASLCYSQWALSSHHNKSRLLSFLLLLSSHEPMSGDSFIIDELAYMCRNHHLSSTWPARCAPYHPTRPPVSYQETKPDYTPSRCDRDRSTACVHSFPPIRGQ